MNQTGALRKLLAAFDAHEAMLVAYRTGGRAPGKAIDTITRVKTVLPQIRELIDRPDSDPHTETLWTGPAGALGRELHNQGTRKVLDVDPADDVRVVRADTPHHKATP